MTKTYELPNEKRLMADVDEKRHTATVSVYALDDLVEVVNKTGHWIDIDDIKSECSECGHREPNERFIFEDINFCAKCGARMIELQGGEKV